MRTSDIYEIAFFSIGKSKYVENLGQRWLILNGWEEGEREE